MVFQETLGTMKEKADRIVALAKHLAADAQLGAADAADAERAAYLAKADLVTNAVVEFTSVQGVMGSYYAEASGENEQVARAIADHYRPRFSGDEPPASDVGLSLIHISRRLRELHGRLRGHPYLLPRLRRHAPSLLRLGGPRDVYKRQVCPSFVHAAILPWRARGRIGIAGQSIGAS